MRILYFYQYFSTNRGAWGTRVFEFARNWVEKGHNVTVVTAIYAKSDLKSSKFIDTQMIDGINVKIINVLIDNRQSIPRRIWSFLVFSLMACYFALTLPCDLVIASSGPITIGLPGLVARYLRGKKLVFEVRDLWPQGAIELGIIRNSLIKWVAYKFEKLCYRSSRLIVTLSPGMRDNIIQRYNHPNVISVTNGVDVELFGQQNNSPGSLPKYRYAIYTGNVGDVNNSLWLLEAARILHNQGRDDIVILIIGEGQLRETIDSAIVREKLPNLYRLDLMPKADLVRYVQGAVVSLVPLKGTEVLDHSSPNKFFESLAAGVPVIQNTNGWLKEFLSKHQLGYTISPDDPGALAALLIHLFESKDSLHEMRLKARQVALEYFDKNKLSQQMLDRLVAVYES